MKNLQSKFILCGIFALAAFLQFYRIGSPPLWLDEALSYYRSVLPVSEIFRTAYLWDVHPATYYILLHFWKCLGNSEAVLRLLSMVFSFLSLPVIYCFSRKIKGDRFALAVAFLLSVSVLHVRYAQEVRSYALFFFVSLFVYFLFYLALQQNKPRVWFLWALFSVLNLYVHYFAALLFLSQMVWVFLIFCLSPDNRRRIHWKAFIFAGIFIAAAFTPQLWFFFKQAGAKVSTVSEVWRAANPVQFAFIFLKTFAYPLTLSNGFLDRGLKYLIFMILILGNGFAWSRYKREILFHGFHFVFILLITWSASFFIIIPAPYKYVIFANAPFILLCATALFGILDLTDSISFGKGLRVILVGLFLFGCAIVYRDYYRTPRAEEWKSGVESIRSKYQPGDPIIPLPDYSDYQFRYYAEKNQFTPPVTRLKTESLDTLQVYLQKTNRTYLITIGSSNAEMRRIQTFLAAHATLIWQDQYFPDTRVWMIQRSDLSKSE